MKTLIYLGLFVGSTVGSFVPLLWGADLFSLSSVLCSTIGALLGIWAGYKIGQAYL